MSDYDYEMGQIQQRLDTQDERHDSNIERLTAIETTLQKLVESIAIAKGGMRLLFAVGSLAAAMGAFAHSILTWAGEHIK